ncbi:hypothetical protein [Leeuwenhoekiella sp. MAR_2009_132]|uniref:hypothetical protein n=1 Tax=Leeuwenhoekiella sp. MAR_2009_132 TaxID=1392489 RepID=UPI00048F7694|nr:hypothetical protein [Leeuwenhoekiella sp. MAR_2009_132]
MQVVSNNLNTFRVLYIVKGVLSLLAALFFVGYLAFLNIFINESTTMPDANIDVMSVLNIIMGIGFILCLIVGILTLMAAKYIGQTCNYTFVLVIAILNCLSGILGIILGVFTIIEINKPHIKMLFDQND